MRTLGDSETAGENVQRRNNGSMTREKKRGRCFRGGRDWDRCKERNSNGGVQEESDRISTQKKVPAGTGGRPAQIRSGTIPEERSQRGRAWNRRIPTLKDDGHERRYWNREFSSHHRFLHQETELRRQTGRRAHRTGLLNGDNLILRISRFDGKRMRNRLRDHFARTSPWRSRCAHRNLRRRFRDCTHGLEIGG